MRIAYMSDLHLEMESFRLAIPGWADFMARHKKVLRHPSRGPMLDELGNIDLVVLAGDIHNGLRGIVYADQVSAYLDVPVLMIAGNHEYYHHDAMVLLPALRDAAGAFSRERFRGFRGARRTGENIRRHLVDGFHLARRFDGIGFICASGNERLPLHRYGPDQADALEHQGLP
jgi:DNA repair exonuclease SbcCD nuclease subunit